MELHHEKSGESAPINRRDFIHRSSAGLGFGWLAANIPILLSTANLACQAASDQAEFTVLSVAEAELTDSLASMIIPTDDTPGAHEAGVVYFIDLALGSFAAPELGLIRSGLADVQQRVNEVRSNEYFEDLSDSEKGALMGSIEDSPFFSRFRYLTLAGMFSHPKYGGNRDKIGWLMIGFDDRHVWQHPFGYYDAELDREEG